MIEIIQNFPFSFLPNISYTVSKFLSNGGRVKESYKGMGGVTNLRLYSHSNNSVIANEAKLSNFSNSLLTTFFSLYHKMAAPRPVRCGINVMGLDSQSSVTLSNGSSQRRDTILSVQKVSKWRKI
jgi:hypothetical protein